MSVRATELWTYFGSLMGLIALGQTILNSILPMGARMVLARLFARIADYISKYAFIDIPEFDSVTNNELYSAIKLHLSSTTPLQAKRLHVCRSMNSTSFTFSAANNERLPETFQGTQVFWEHRVIPKEHHSHSWRHMPDEKRSFILKVHKKDKDRILVPFMEHIMEHAKEIRRLNRDRLLYTNTKNLSWDSRSQPWESVPFKHPSTFETLALDPARKQQIMADLQSFAKGEQFYRKTGRAWKRGYLLYGPPGTGKSSMIAAMANFLGYDIYDLELTEVQTNGELRKLLIKTTNKSIIVIEDIDCSLNLTNRSKSRQRHVTDPGALAKPDEQSTSMTLSGLLNFTDGLWSCCGSERIFVFTTNHIERLDPALLRSGRMDMHIHMSYCTFAALQILVSNYLGLDDHYLYPDLQQMIDDAHMTPADVSEILIKNRDDPNIAMEDLRAELKAAQAKPWPPPPVQEDSVVEDAEEEKHTLEDKPSDNSSKQSVVCDICEKAVKLHDL